MNDFHETPEYKQGHEGELTVQEQLRAQGSWVLPLYRMVHENAPKRFRAPRILKPYEEGTQPNAQVVSEEMEWMLNGGFTIPDLLSFRPEIHANPHWTEVKTFSIPTYTRVTGTYDHGVKRKLLEAYYAVRKHTDCPCSVVVVELCTGDITWLPIEALVGSDKKAWVRENTFNGNTTDYWPRNRMRYWFNFEQEKQNVRTLLQPPPPHVIADRQLLKAWEPQIGNSRTDEQATLGM